MNMYIKNKKFLVYLTVMLIGLSNILCFTSLDVYADSIKDFADRTVAEIYVGGSASIKTNQYEFTYIKFSPAEDGYYEFFTDNDCNTDIDIFSDQEETIRNMDYINRYECTESGKNNLIISAFFEKGINYYFHPYNVDADIGVYQRTTLYCIKESKDIYNYKIKNSLLDLNYKYRKEIQFAKIQYTGKPVEYSNIQLIYSRSNDVENVLEYDKDWMVTGYCDRETFLSGADARDNKGIIWKEGAPSAKGDYVARIVGKGDYIKSKYLGFTVMSDRDLSSFNPVLLTSSGQSITYERGKNVYVKLIPSETKEYIIKSDYEYDNHKTSINVDADLYDKNGNYVIPKKKPSYSEFEITVDLTAGETYYLCVYIASNVSYKDENGDRVYVHPDKIDFQILIPGYVYKHNDSEKKNSSKDNKTKKTNEIKPSDKQKVNKEPDSSTKNNIPLSKGKTFIVNKVKYKVTASKKGNYQVSVVKCNNKKIKKINVAASVKYKGVTYKITSIGANAYSGCSKATSVTIGKNVKSIGAKAFYKCSKVKKINVKSKVLKNIGKDAFKGISKKAKVTGSKKIKL